MLEGKAAVKFKGLNANEIHAKFGYTPQQLGIKLRDLVYPSMNNTEFKGCLVRSSPELEGIGVDYELSMKLSLQDTETFLDAKNNIHQGQADKLVTYLSSPSMVGGRIKRNQN